MAIRLTVKNAYHGGSIIVNLNRATSPVYGNTDTTKKFVVRKKLVEKLCSCPKNTAGCLCLTNNPQLETNPKVEVFIDPKDAKVYWILLESKVSTEKSLPETTISTPEKSSEKQKKPNKLPPAKLKKLVKLEDSTKKTKRTSTKAKKATVEACPEIPTMNDSEAPVIETPVGNTKPVTKENKPRISSKKNKKLLEEVSKQQEVITQHTIQAEKNENRKLKLNLVGVNGNAIALLSHFQKEATADGWTKTEIDAVRKEASSKDYEHLVSTLLNA
uniref:Uncharacterized protein n=2 Tax=viral metagenome TaxID=1070528 RepID=A0A6M3L664_9ZZZZ